MPFCYNFDPCPIINWGTFIWHPVSHILSNQISLNPLYRPTLQLIFDYFKPLTFVLYVWNWTVVALFTSAAVLTHPEALLWDGLTLWGRERTRGEVKSLLICFTFICISKWLAPRKGKSTQMFLPVWLCSLCFLPLIACVVSHQQFICESRLTHTSDSLWVNLS